MGGESAAAAAAAAHVLQHALNFELAVSQRQQCHQQQMFGGCC
jgi:hypothetical protein